MAAEELKLYNQLCDARFTSQHEHLVRLEEKTNRTLSDIYDKVNKNTAHLTNGLLSGLERVEESVQSLVEYREQDMQQRLQRQIETDLSKRNNKRNWLITGTFFVLGQLAVLFGSGAL